MNRISPTSPTSNSTPRSVFSILKTLPNESTTPLWKYTPNKKCTFPGISTERKTNKSPTSFVFSPKSAREISMDRNETLQILQQTVLDKMDAYFTSGEYDRLRAAFRGDSSPYYNYLWAPKEKEALKKPEKNIVTLFQDVTHYYNLYVHIESENSYDSALTIYPLKPDTLVFHQFLNLLLIQLTKFPITFFKKLGLRGFSFCRYASLNKRGHKDIYYKRLLTGLFEVEKLKNIKDLKYFFYKLVCYHIGKISNTFNSGWVKLNPPRFVYTREPERVGKTQGFLNLECMQSQQMDQAQILEKIMIDHKRILNHADEIIRKKALLLMEHISFVDPDFNELKGWESNSSYLPLV